MESLPPFLLSAGAFGPQRTSAARAVVRALAFGAALPALAAAGGSKACSHTGFYSKKVVPLCEAHFPDVESKHAWLVQFYHPYQNGGSKALEELAADKGATAKLKIGGVDCKENGPFCQQHGVKEAPTTRFLLRGQSREYDSGKDMKAFVEESFARVEALEEALKCKVKGVFTDPGKDSAVPLCTANFPPALEPVPWLISFYESGEKNKDKTMRSVMNKLAGKFGNVPPKNADAKRKVPLKLRFGAVDCSEQKGCDALGVTTFPTVRFYRAGAEPVDYDSFFDREELQAWASARLKEMKKPEAVPILQMDKPEGAGSESRKSTDGTNAEL